MKFAENKKSADSLSLLRYTAVAVCIFTFSFLFLYFPSQTSSGVSRGLSLCTGSVIPSLFPFMIISDFFAAGTLCEKLSRVFEKPMRFIFGLDRISAPVMLMSFIGGFPIGASMTASLVEKERLSREEGRRLMSFCVCPGPAFVISFVGSSLLSSPRAGIIIYASLIISAMLTGFLSRFVFEKQTKNYRGEKVQNDTPFSQQLSSSVSKSVAKLAVICGWIMLFSALLSLIGELPLSTGTGCFLSCLLEVTNGCDALCGHFPIPVIAGAIGWGGICTHCQIMPELLKIGVKLKEFCAFRIINAALSFCICRLLILAFPVELSVFSHTDVRMNTSQSSAAVSIFMIASSIIFLLGNNAVIKISSKRRGD